MRSVSAFSNLVLPFRQSGYRLRLFIALVILVVLIVGSTWMLRESVAQPSASEWKLTAGDFHSECFSSAKNPADKNAGGEASAFVCPWDPIKDTGNHNGTVRQLDALKLRLCQLVKKKLQSALSRRGSVCAGLVPKNLTATHSIYHEEIEGRLGNFLFVVASLVGIARENGMFPAMTAADSRMTDFLLDVLPVMRKSPPKAATAVQEKGVYLDDNVFHLGNSPKNGPIAIRKSFLQSWKYFKDVREDIRAIFTFGTAVYTWAVESILKSIREVKLGNDTSSLTLVAIHIRRGDILKDPHKKHGHVPASEAYLQGTAADVEKKYGPVVFLVLSNDIAYCKSVFKLSANYVFVDGNSPAVDMALMTLMDVVVMSVGSFGWWGAYLSDAKEVFYYEDWPRPGSELFKLTKKKDYFLPSWHGRR